MQQQSDEGLSLLEKIGMGFIIAFVLAFASSCTDTMPPDSATNLKMVEPKLASNLTGGTMVDLEKAVDGQSHVNWMLKRSIIPEKYLWEIWDSVKDEKQLGLVLAIINIESHFNPLVKSKVGAMGLMQIMPNIWMKELKKEGIIEKRRDLYEIPQNIRAGLYVLNVYLESLKGNENLDALEIIEKALLKYSGGSKTYPDRVLKSLGSLYLEVR